MSAGNLFETRRKAFKLRTKEITTSASLITYTTRAGGTGDNFIVDRVINVTTTSGNNMAITVSNGVYEGQRLLINFTAEGGTDTVDSTATTGGAFTQLTDIGGYNILEWVNTTTGWVEVKASAT